MSAPHVVAITVLLQLVIIYTTKILPE